MGIVRMHKEDIKQLAKNNNFIPAQARNFIRPGFGDKTVPNDG